MIGAFLYLTRRGFANRFKRLVSRLRNPRYAIAILVGIAYIWFFLGRRSGFDGGGPFAFLTTDVGRNAIALLLTLLFAKWWGFGGRIDSLAFSPAEVHFLFPSPATRRQLIIFKLIRIQLGTLLNMVIWVLLLRRGGADLNPLMRALGLWVFFSTISMHGLGASLFHASIREHGVTGLRRQKLATLIVVLVLLAFGATGMMAYREVAAGLTVPTQPLQIIGGVLQHPNVTLLLSPVRAILTPALSSSTADWLAAIPAALLIMALHFIWVLNAKTAFEEAAAEASARMAQRIENFRKRGQGVPRAAVVRKVHKTGFPLPLWGPPAIAIIWKNAIAIRRTTQPGTVLALVFMVVGTGAMMLAVGSRESALATSAVMMAVILVMSIAFGPRSIRNDLRSDMALLALLKTYPIPGRSLVAAEVISGALTLTIFQVAMLLLLFGISLAQDQLPISLLDRGLLLLTLPLALATVNSVNMSVQNGAALMFPAWMSFGPTRPTGVEALGQNLLLSVATLLLLMLALIPAVLSAVLTAFLLSFLPDRIALLGATMSALAILVVELQLALQWLGRVFDRTDVTASQ